MWLLDSSLHIYSGDPGQNVLIPPDSEQTAGLPHTKVPIPGHLHLLCAQTRMGAALMEGPSVAFCIFILITLFSLNVTVKVRKLDLAPDAVDDDFSQCRDRMLKAVTEPGGLLQKELSNDENFKSLWNKHSGVCKENITGGTPYHTDALLAFGNSKPEFRRNFNEYVYSKGNNDSTYGNEFPLKSLHFLLTDSLRLLSHTNICTTVYYGTEETYTVDNGTEVRFGKFINAHIELSDEIEAVVSERVTIFNITSCSVVNVEENVCKSEELQCLISPAEVFTVQDVRNVITPDGDEYEEIILTHSRFLSNHHCTFIHGNAAVVGSSTSLTFSLLTLMTSMLTQFTMM